MAAQKKAGGGADYRNLTDSIKSGQIGRFYILRGEERYLLESSLGELRRVVCPDGLDGFNYKRYEGKSITPEELEDAVNTLPVFAERTLVELHDFDVFSDEHKRQMAGILSDLPEYICLVIVYDTVAYKPDGRQKLDKAILQNAQVIDFEIQEQSVLTKWIARHFREAGKSISAPDAAYLVYLTGGHMTSLYGEIGKISAYAAGDSVSRADIDAVVAPVMDAVAYKLTDALFKREHGESLRLLDELLRMREAPQKLLFSISLKMRQLLAARVCIDNGRDWKALSDMCGIRYEFQAKMLMSTARTATLDVCREAVLYCAEAAFSLNSEPEPEARLIELILRLSYDR